MDDAEFWDKLYRNMVAIANLINRYKLGGKYESQKVEAQPNK